MLRSLGALKKCARFTVVAQKLVEPGTRFCDGISMSNKFPFGPDSPLYEAMKLQREQSDLIKRAMGPNFALPSAIKPLPSVFTALDAVEKSGILKTAAMLKGTRVSDTIAAAEALRMSRVPVLKDFASTSWLLQIQRTAMGINRDPTGILAAQKLLIGSTIADMVKLGSMFEANRAIIGKLMAGSQVGDQIKALSERMAPSLGILKVAAERARTIDMMTLRATAEAVATSSAVVMAEQVIEAHRLIEAIGHAEDPAQSVDLLAAFMQLIGVIFSTFGDNTLKELRNVGAIALIGFIMTVYGIYKEVVPADLTPAEQKVHAEMKVQVETLQEKIDKIIAANQKADEAYVANLPRAELKRDAPIRREPQGKAQILMRGDAGTLLAVKDSRGKWRLVVYRDPLTDQLSEGWVFAPAVELLNIPEQ